MKILYVITQSSWGGAQKYVYTMASNLASKEGLEIIVAGGLKSKGKLAEKLSKDGINFIALKYLVRSINPIKDILSVFELRKLIEQEKPDIINLNSSKAGAVGSMAAKLARHRAKVIYTVHGWVFNESLNPIVKSAYYLIEKYTARLKDLFICLSDYDRYAGIRRKIASANKLIVVRNGIDLETLQFIDTKQARKKLIGDKSIPDQAAIIGTIANFYPTKGLEYLIEAVKILVQDYKLPIIAIIIGEGQLRQELERQINDLKLQDSVILAGSVPAASNYLKAFDIAVISSVKEGAPFFLLEAMSAGLPIVATKVGGIPEIITDNETGFLIEPKNTKRMVEKIKTLAENSNLRIKMGQAGLKKVKEEFSQEKMIQETLDLYQK